MSEVRLRLNPNTVELAINRRERRLESRSHAPRGNAVFDALRRPGPVRGRETVGTRSVRDGIPTRSVGTSRCKFFQINRLALIQRYWA